MIGLDTSIEAAGEELLCGGAMTSLSSVVRSRCFLPDSRSAERGMAGSIDSGVALRQRIVASGDPLFCWPRSSRGRRGSDWPSFRFRVLDDWVEVVAGVESKLLGLERLNGVDSASGKNSSSSSRSKVDESWSIFCRMLGCLRRGFRVPSMEVSREGVGCAGRSILPGALIADDTAAIVGPLGCPSLVDVFTTPFGRKEVGCFAGLEV